MTTSRIVATSHASLKAKIVLVPGKTRLFSHIDLPGILLREIQVGQITQYGGFVIIQRNAAGNVRTIGAAGSWLGKFASQSKPGGTLSLTYGGVVQGLGSLQPTSGSAFINAGYKTLASKPTNIAIGDPANDSASLAAFSGYDTGDSFWTAANITEELIMGWVCPVNSALIWQGPVRLAIGDGTAPYQVMRWQTPISMIAQVDAPLDMDWSKIDLASFKADYMLTVDEDVREYVEAAWDESIYSLTSVTRISQPVAVSYSQRGLEIGMAFGHVCNGKGHDSGYLSDQWNGHFFSGYRIANTATATDGTTPLNCGAVHQRAAGSLFQGVVLPRLYVTRNAGSYADMVAAACAIVDPVTVTSVSTFPATIGGLQAAPLIGPVFPLMYAFDAPVHASGDISMTNLITVLEDMAPKLNTAPVVSTPGNGTTTRGDASITNENSPLVMPASTLDTYGYGVNAVLKAFFNSVRSKGESKARADMLKFGF
jgi:hypothetical protein